MRAYADPTSELHRKLNPNWRLEAPEVRLLAEIATIQSSSRYLQVMQIMQGGDVPEQYWPARYGIPADDEAAPSQVTDSADADERARAVRNEIMAG